MFDDSAPGTGLRIGRWVPEMPDPAPGSALLHRPVPPVPVRPDPPLGLAERKPVRRVFRLSRRRLFAMGLVGAPVLLLGAVLMQPDTRPAQFRADPASPAAESPAAASAAVTVLPSAQSQRRSAATTTGVRPSPSAATGVTVLAAGQEGRVRSRDDVHGTAIQFVNDRDEPVVVYWLDYRGARERYAVIDSGASRRQPTFVGHPWLVTDLAGHALTIFLPAARPARATIT